MPSLRGLILVGALMVTSSLALALWFGAGGASRKGGEADKPEVSEATLRLRAILGRYRRAWQPEQRADVVGELQAALPELAAPLGALLGRDEDPDLGAAVELAGQIGFADALPHLSRLALGGPESVRPAAVLAHGRLGPFAAAELEALLADRDPAVQAAAVRVAGPSEPRMVVALLPLLFSQFAPVRDAVVEAMPAPLTSEELGLLLTAMADADDAGRAAAVRLLARNAEHPEVEELLVEMAGGSDAGLRAAAVEALAARRTPLSRPEDVLALALDTELSQAERARALLCLERTRSPAADRVLAEIIYLTPELRYFAGRYLLSLGHSEGADVLLDLLDEAALTGLGLGEEAAGLLLRETRRILAVVSGQSMDAPVAELRAWFSARRQAKPRALPEPLLDLS